MSELTMQNLVRHFEAVMQQKDRDMLGEMDGREPQYPMVIVYLGEISAQAHQRLSEELFQLWPQYRREICFIGIRDYNVPNGYFNVTQSDGNQVLMDIAESELQSMVSKLFGLETHFQNRSRLLVYYVLDTAQMTDQAELILWANAAQRFREAALTEIVSMWFILLKEGFEQKKLASRIRNSLHEVMQQAESDFGKESIFLLSSRRNDNVIIGDWTVCYQIAANIIALSNNSSGQILAALFTSGIKTVSYAKEEKPFAQIGQVIVQKLLSEIEKSRAGKQDLRLTESEVLPGRLGLEMDGTWQMLNEYTKEHLIKLLPSREQIKAFPRINDKEYEDISELTADELNELTMGAWDCCLRNISAQGEEKLVFDVSSSKAWNEKYKYVRKNFKKSELIALKANLEHIRNIFQRQKVPSGDTNCLSYAQEKLKYTLSSNLEIQKIFLDVIEQWGLEAEEFVKSWESLLNSRRHLFSVEDETIISLYAQRARNYFDGHGSAVTSELDYLETKEEIEPFLKRIIEKIINNDEVFSLPFDSELQARAQLQDTQQYIRQKLTGPEVPTYLRVNFALSQPLVSAVLIKQGTPLYKNLKENLPESTYYYNTVRASAAQALVVYRVDGANLVVSEGG